MLTETEKSYIAGFLDADGCYNLSKKYNKKHDYHYFQAQIRFGNTNKNFMKWLYEKLKNYGHPYWYKEKQRPRLTKNPKPYYRVDLGSYKAIKKFLDDLKPYIKIKTRPHHLNEEKIKWLEKRNVPFW